MKRRMLAVLALAATGWLAGADAHAANGYWACIALDQVDVGTCLSNPLPDPNQWGSVRGIVYESTGIRV